MSLSSPPPSPASTSWIARLLDRPENAFMCVVDAAYVRDRFNLTGLDELVPDLDRAARTVLDEGRPSNAGDEAAAAAESAARLLYGLVHARYVMTPKGVAKMFEKFAAECFGHCPRVNCERSPVLPIGLSDTPRAHTVKLYCPRCTDVYEPATGVAAAKVDGAYFGTGFPHMAFMTSPEYRPPRPKGRHVARLYGFRVHQSACDVQRCEAAERRRSHPVRGVNRPATPANGYH